MNRFSFRRLFLAQIAFIGVLAIGTLGFVAPTDEGWVPSFHRSVVTTTLTGLDSRHENQAAQIFTVVLLLAGVAIFLYLAGAVVELITRGVVGDYFGEGRRKRAIGQLRNHTIICGFARVGRSVAAEFAHAEEEYVVINMVLKPQVADYLDVVSTAGGEELRFEEITVGPTCAASGRPLADLAIQESTGTTVVALRRGAEVFVTAPAPEAILNAGDVLIGVGSADPIWRLEEMFEPGDFAGV